MTSLRSGIPRKAYLDPVETNFSPAQVRARRKILEEVADAGGGFVDAAGRFDITIPALFKWATIHMPDVAERLGANGRAKRGSPLSRKEILSRLRMVTTLGVIETARARGIHVQTLYGWLKRNAPDGAASWLAELTSPE